MQPIDFSVKIFSDIINGKFWGRRQPSKPKTELGRCEVDSSRIHVLFENKKINDRAA